MARERDARNDIRDRLVKTGRFDMVTLAGLPEDYGVGASKLALAVIEPESTSQSDRYDGGPGTGSIVTARLTITLLARDDDPQLRDEACENLLMYAEDALNGRSLADLTFPDLTRFTGWRWLPATPPERRIAAQFSFDYPIPAWDGFDTSD